MFIAMTLDMELYTDRLVTRYNRHLPEGEHEVKRFFGPGCLGGMATHFANRITLVGHASTTHFGSHPDYGRGIFSGYKPKELANAIVNEAKLPNIPGMIIDLVGCETGLSLTGEPNYAEKFAKIMAEEYGYDVHVKTFTSEAFDQNLDEESKIARMLVTSDHDPPGVVRIIGIPVSQADMYDQQNEKIGNFKKEEKKIKMRKEAFGDQFADSIITLQEFDKIVDAMDKTLKQIEQDKASATTALKEMENEFVLFTSYEQENNKDISVREAMDTVGRSYHFLPIHRDFDAMTFGQLETSVYIPTSDELAPDADCTVAKPGASNEALSSKASSSEPPASTSWDKKRSEYATKPGERLTSLATNKKTKHEDEKPNTPDSQLTSSNISSGKK